MDCQLSCTSPLPWIWVLETLARSNQVDISLLLDLLEKTPEISDDLGRNARELVSLRILESFSSQGARANPVSSASSQKIRLDPSDHCEDVLRQILTETSPSHLKPAGPEMLKWDLQPFIEHKRSSLAKYALQQVKDGILSGSRSFFASLKEQSGLPVGNQAVHEAPVDDDNRNGITQRHEGSSTDDDHLPRDLPDENVVQVNRKRRATSEIAGRKLSENGRKIHIKSVKKYKHDIYLSEQSVGGEGGDTQLGDVSKVSIQHNEGNKCSLGRKTHVGGMGLPAPAKDDNNEYTSLKGLVGPDEVLPCENQAHCDTELHNKSEEEQELGHNIEESKADNEGFSALKMTNEDVNRLEENIPRNITNVREVEEDDYISIDSDRTNGDRTDNARKNNASCSRQCAHSQDSLTTRNNWSNLNLLADSSQRFSEEDRCRLGEKTHAEFMGQNGPPGDGDNKCTSSKERVGHNEVLPHENQAPNCGTEVPNNKFDGEKRQGLIPSDKDMEKQDAPRNVSTVGEPEEDVDVSSDSDGYHDERTKINTTKKTFLNSQCTYSQDSLATTDWRELNLCVKCNKGGKLLVCSSNSCPLVIHESCLGSDASFDPRGIFYCPFCSYSRAISKYMEIKKKASFARKDLATFICLGTKQEAKEHSQRSCDKKQNHLEQDDGLPESNERDKRDAVKVVSNSQRRKKLEYEEPGPSELCSGYTPPFGGKAVDSTNRKTHILNKEKKEGKRTRQVSQSPRVHGQQQTASQEIHKSQSENGSFQVPETRSRSEKHAVIRSKKGVLCQPETDIPGENRCSQSSQSADEEEISEDESESSGVSKYFIRFRKQERQSSYPAIPQVRRKRHPWTMAEEDTLKKGMQLLCGPHDKIIPWKRILEFGDRVFQKRSTIDLKDKWRNMCKASPKSK